MLKKVICYGVLALTTPMAAIAQTPPDPVKTTDPVKAATDTAKEKPAEMAEFLEIVTAPFDVKELNQEPAEIDLRLIDVPAANNLTDGVIARGYGRAVKVDDKTIGQVVLTELAKDEKVETLESSKFTAQFDLKAEKLKPEEPVTIKANREALIKALENLQGEKAQPAEPTDEKGESSAQSGAPTGANAQPQQSNWQTPDYIEKKEEKTETPPDPEEEIKITSSGCPIRVDVEQMKAFVQSKSQTTVDGTLKSESACTDSSKAYPLQKSYTACAGEDIIDTSLGTATSQFQYYYVDDGGNNVTYGDCRKDTDSVFKITEIEDGCSYKVDEGTNKVTFYVKSVYTDRNNKQQVVQDCHPSENKAPQQMEKVYEGCPALTEGNSVTQQYRKAITVDGKQQFVTECTPDGETTKTTITTAEGCEIRVDDKLNRAFVQTRQQVTLKDGTIESQTACADSDQYFPLEKSYAACQNKDIIDLDGMVATAQYQLFYVTQKGETHTHGDCQPDSDTTYKITEKHDCKVQLDFTEGKEKAVFESRLVYNNRNGQETEARGCAPSVEKEAVSMISTQDGCTIRHDLQKEQSFRQSKWIYKDEGLTYQASECMDDGTIYPHEKVFKAGGANVCAPIINLDQTLGDDDNGNVILQYKRQITVDGKPQYISDDCVPDNSNVIKILPTYDGCDDPATWFHDISAGYSVDKERYYYLDNGARKYVTECRLADGTFGHKYETTGWEMHDEGVYALPVSTTYINSYAGRYDVQTNTIRPGATQQPYEYISQENIGTGQYTWEGCNRNEAVNIVKHYKRPDETIYDQIVGQAPPLTTPDCTQSGGRFVSDYQLSDQKVRQLSRSETGDCIMWGEGNCKRYDSTTYFWAERDCQYQSDVVTTRGDGQQMADQSFTITEWILSAQKGPETTHSTSTTVPECATPPYTAAEAWANKYGVN